MNPPRPTKLPDDIDGTAARRTLERWTPDERRAAATALLTVPDPARDWRASEVAAELLLAAEDSRVERLIQAALSVTDLSDERRSTAALWRFRWALGALDGQDQPGLEAALDEARDAGATGAELAEALRLSASTAIAAANAPGAEWIVPCAGGRRVANLAAALLRRPALADELGNALSWLKEAEALSPGRGEGGIEGIVSAAEEADRSGRLDEGGERLQRAWSRAGGSDDLAAALEARSAVLMEPRWARLVAEAGGALDTAAVAPPTLAPKQPLVQAPAPPDTGWADQLPALAVPAGSESEPAVEPAHRALLEAAGAHRRAAVAWLQRGALTAHLHAHRLRDALPPGSRDQLLETLQAAIAPDEHELASDPTLYAGAVALLELLPQDAEAQRRGWELRLRAVAPAAETSDDDAPAAADDDPHSTANRLAAAADLASAGRLEAAASVVAALFKHVETDEDRRTLIAVSRDILKDPEPPPSFVGAVERLLAGGFHADGDGGLRQKTAAAMLDALVTSPLMAYPLHASLHRAAVEAEGLNDLQRVRLLEAWLGIWRATATPPAVDAVRKVARAAPLLMALAAFRLAGAEDPITAAVDFHARYPSRTTSATALADALLAACSAA